MGRIDCLAAQFFRHDIVRVKRSLNQKVRAQVVSCRQAGFNPGHANLRVDAHLPKYIQYLVPT